MPGGVMARGTYPQPGTVFRRSPGLTGADALVDELTRHDVEVVFGLVGSQTLPIIDALYRAGSIRYVAVRDEQAAAFMAYGYSRARQRPGVCLATAGPAATNLLSGVA